MKLQLSTTQRVDEFYLANARDGRAVIVMGKSRDGESCEPHIWITKASNGRQSRYCLCFDLRDGISILNGSETMSQIAGLVRARARTEAAA